MESDDGVNANSPSPRRLENIKASFLANIQTEIRAMRADVEKELTALCHKLRKDVKGWVWDLRKASRF
jgi:hypothetical protein